MPGTGHLPGKVGKEPPWEEMLSLFQPPWDRPLAKGSWGQRELGVLSRGPFWGQREVFALPRRSLTFHPLESSWRQHPSPPLGPPCGPTRASSPTCTRAWGLPSGSGVSDW